jgi:hypothetical protein
MNTLINNVCNQYLFIYNQKKQKKLELNLLHSLFQYVNWKMSKYIGMNKNCATSIAPCLCVCMYPHVNIFWVKTRLKRGWVASKTQRTNASQVKHSTRPDAVQLRNAFARVLVLNASRRDFVPNRVSGETFHASRRVQNKILIIWKININPSQIRTELPSTLFLDGLGLPWRTDWILPWVMTIRFEHVN